MRKTWLALTLSALTLAGALPTAGCSSGPSAAGDRAEGDAAAQPAPVPSGDSASPTHDAAVDSGTDVDATAPGVCPKWNAAANGGASCSKRWSIQTACGAHALAAATMVTPGLRLERAATGTEKASVMLRLDQPFAGDFDVELELGEFQGDPRDHVAPGADHSAFILRAIGATSGGTPAHGVAGVTQESASEVALRPLAGSSGPIGIVNAGPALSLRVWRTGSTLNSSARSAATTESSSLTSVGPITLEFGIPSQWEASFRTLNGKTSALVKSIRVASSEATYTETFACNSIAL